MRAAWFERYGPARDVLKVGELPTPEPGQGEVRVRVHASGINPSDVKRRSGIREQAGYPLIVPHSDGAGVIDALGPGVEGWKVPLLHRSLPSGVRRDRLELVLRTVTSKHRVRGDDPERASPIAIRCEDLSVGEALR